MSYTERSKDKLAEDKVQFDLILCNLYLPTKLEVEALKAFRERKKHWKINAYGVIDEAAINDCNLVYLHSSLCK